VKKKTGLLYLVAIAALAVMPTIGFGQEEVVETAAAVVETAAATTEAAAPAATETAAAATEAAPDSSASAAVEVVEHDAMFLVNNLWIMIAGMLVFIMHLGFATLESGLTRSKNTVNILFKNTMIVCLGLITYGIAGYSIMYPGFDAAPDDHDEAVSGAYEYADGGYFKFAGFGFLTLGKVLLPVV